MKGLRRGTRLGKYRLEKRLGEGGSAEVWAGRDTVESRRVAIKVISPTMVEEFGRSAIEHEARVAARLDHPNIVTVRNADWVGPYFILVTDVAERCLEGYREPRRSPELALSILHDVARGLAHAHSRKILHRDVKPANILLYPGRVAKLADFGTARFAPPRTALFTEVGTVGHMAPEQAYGRPTYASDVFGLGLVGYQLYTGVLPRWPFEKPLDAQANFEARAPVEVQRVILKALSVSIDKRWPNGVELLRALESAMERARQRTTRALRSRSKTPRARASAQELEFRWFRREYGKALELRFDCCQCGGPIGEAMTHCPWCGTDENSFLEVSRYPLVCPDCERGVRPEWNACPWCYTGRFESNGKRPPRDPHAERECRRRGCDGQIRPFMRYCPQCKTKVARPWKVENMTRCKRCRWPSAPRWRFCAWCGRKNHAALTVRSGGRTRAGQV